MITDAIINLAYSVLSGMISWLPAGSGFPSQVHSAASFIGAYLDIFSPIVPTATLLTVVSLVFSFEIALFGFRTLRWIISHLPFVGGR